MVHLIISSDQSFKLTDRKCKCAKQKNIFPLTLINIICKISEVRHNSITAIKLEVLIYIFKITMKKLHTVGLLLIKNRKLLLAYSNNKQCFYLPGGKVDAGETAMQALCREIQEELNTALLETDLVFYTHISAPAYGEAAGVVMEQDCFILQQPIKPVAAAEIGRLQYFSVKEYKKETNIAPGAVMVLEQLQKDCYID